MKKADLTGRVFKRLTVIKEVGQNNSGKSRWLCRCECGNETVGLGAGLIDGKKESCGCLRIENSRKHGFSGKNNAEYTCWMNMRRRCNDKTRREYKHYGGRGIRVCKRWDSFVLFLNDMGKRPSGKHTLERKNTNKGYSPSNCKWATWEEQQNNKRNNHYIKHNGKIMTIAGWSRELKARAASLSTMMKKKSFKDCVEYYKEKKINNGIR